MPSLSLLGHQAPVLPHHLHFLCLLSPAFPTCVVLGFKLSKARHVSWCPSLQSTYLTLDVFSVEPQLGTYIVVIPHQREGNLAKSGLPWRAEWTSEDSHQMAIGKKNETLDGAVL